MAAIHRADRKATSLAARDSTRIGRSTAGVNGRTTADPGIVRSHTGIQVYILLMEILLKTVLKENNYFEVQWQMN